MGHDCGIDIGEKGHPIGMQVEAAEALSDDGGEKEGVDLSVKRQNGSVVDSLDCRSLLGASFDLPLRGEASEERIDFPRARFGNA